MSTLYTTRITQNETDTAFSIPMTAKHVWIHIEDGEELLKITGKMTGSIAAYITRDGKDIELPASMWGNMELAELATVAGTRTLSVFALV